MSPTQEEYDVLDYIHRMDHARIRALEARAEKAEAALAAHHDIRLPCPTCVKRAAERESGSRAVAKPSMPHAREAAAKSAARHHVAPMPDSLSGGGARRSGQTTGAPFGQAKDPGKAVRLPRRGSAENQECGT